MVFKTTVIFMFCLMVLTSSLVTASPTRDGTRHGETENPANNIPTLQKHSKMPEMGYLKTEVHNSTSSQISGSASYTSGRATESQDLLGPTLRKYLKQVECSTPSKISRSGDFGDSNMVGDLFNPETLSPEMKEFLKQVKCSTSSQISGSIFVCSAVVLTILSL